MEGLKMPKEFIKHRLTGAEEEANAQRSIEDFMMKHIYPRLSKEKREAIDLHLSRKVSVTGAFEFAGVKVGCVR